MISISVRSKKYDCDISIYQKVTVIRGHSGRGKTIFTKAVSDTSGAYSVRVSDASYEIYVLPSKGWYDIIDAGISKCRNRIYVIDDSDFIITSEFAHLFSQDKWSFYIIINRFDTFGVSSMNMIPFSVNETYEFVTNGKGHSLKKFYEYNDISIEHERVNFCLTEDSESGLDFFKIICGGIEVDTSHGKDKILSYLLQNRSKLQNKTVLFFIDLAAFGGWYELFYEYLLSSSMNGVIFSNYNSFEYMLLCSNMFKFDFNKLTNAIITSESSFEILCEKILISLTTGKFYRYNKDSLNKCYWVNCCYRRQRISGTVKEVCDRGLSGEKLSALLRGTEFSGLLCLNN